MSVHDDKILSDLLDLVLLNELLRKDLLKSMSDYIKNFESQTPFDYSKPVAFVDFYDFAHQQGLIELKLVQFLLNLEIFIIKLYKIGEIDKASIKGTKLKALRQSFAHRKSSDILAGKERLVIFMGLTFDLDTLFVANMSEGAKESEHIEYPYSKYTDLLLSDTVKDFTQRKENIKQIRDLNSGLIGELFPNTSVE